MYELILAGSGFIVGAIAVLVVFKYGMKYAVNLVYKIKEDIPLEAIGKPIEQDGTD